jgi:AraC-like DNA-binding protein
MRSLLTKSGYAEDYIRAKFREITGYTPVEFLTKVRISQACSLIDMYGNSLQLSEIAEKCGYTDYVYFSRRFKALTGISPREYLRSKKVLLTN